MKLTLIKSRFGRIPKHLKTLKALGLKKIGQSIIKPWNPQIKGMIKEVSYLLKIEEANQ